MNGRLTLPKSPAGGGHRINNAPTFDVTRVLDDARRVVGDDAPTAELVEEALRRIAFFEREAALRQALERLAAGPALTMPKLQKRDYNSEGGPPRSAKWERIAEAARDPLTWRIRVDGVWRVVADCTADDLRAGAESKRARAAGLEREAAGYCDLAALLEARGAETVADLGDDAAELVREHLAQERQR